MTSTALADRGGPSADHELVAVLAVLFAASTAVTVAWCGSMASMGGMEMPGGWTMSMAWMRMPDQTWPGAAATFLGMWAAMMAAMMLPSLAPMLARYRSSVRAAGDARLGPLTAVVGLGYFAVWTALGLVVYPAGVALADLAMRHDGLSRLVPLAGALVVLAAGALQLTAWKAHALACCRDAHGLGPLSVDRASAWRHGLRIGLDCARCCAGPMAVLLVLGVMDLRAMAVVTAAITAERLGPARIARLIGIVGIAVGLVLIVRAIAPS
jgi:predicted metal-binding membrane protein